MKYFFPKFLLLLVALSLLIVVSCEKEESLSSKLEKLSGLGYFPMQVGNYWKLSNSPKIEIDGIEEINGKEYFRFITDDDTSFYRKTIDNKIYRLRKSTNEQLIFDFNVTINEKWTSSFSVNDSAYIQLKSKNDTIELNHIKLYNCYRYFSNSYNHLLIDDESDRWLAPNIGLIQSEGQLGIFKLEEVQINGIKIKF